MGDIHGHFDELQALLAEVGFDPAKDRLIGVGDLVDRGPDSDLCLDWLARPWFHTVMGNHELMAIQWAEGLASPGDYAINGGRWLMDLGKGAAREYAARFASLPAAIELQVQGRRIGVVHGDVPQWDWGAFVSDLEDPARAHDAACLAMWGREYLKSAANGRVLPPIAGVDTLFVGHTPLKQPTRINNVIYLDTGCCFPGGSLTLMDVASSQAWSRAAHPLEVS